MESDQEISWKLLRGWVNGVTEDLREGRLDGDHVGGSVRMSPICRVPAKVREMNEKAYKPEVVSIGPYHHGEERLQAMEKHKRRALLHFLRRSNQTPGACSCLLHGISPEIMAAYDNLDGKWKDDDQELFLMVMLMDGCFILEVLLTSHGMVEDYDKDDTIFGRHGRFYNVPSIRRDLLLIENQIPLLVLLKLFFFSGVKGYEDDKGLFQCLVEFFFAEYEDVESSASESQKQSLHILDFYRRRLFFGYKDAGGERIQCKFKTSNAPFIPSAVALQDHGILLGTNLWVSLIWFTRRNLLSAGIGGMVLYIPELTVDDTTESVLLNAMAFESLCPAADATFTSYVSLMSDLIISPMDANLLSTELGIIRNGLGSDQALVDLFRNLSSANFLPDHGLFTLQATINEYCGRRWNRFRAYLHRTYFRNPWAQISFFSAILLFVLTAIQVFYTVYPVYINKKHNPK